MITDVSTNLAKYQSKNPVKKILLNKFLDTIVKNVTQKNPRTLLDAGCGEGVVLKLLHKQIPEAEIVGLDISDAAIIIAAKENPKAIFRKGNISKIPFPENMFDVVMALEVLEHLDNPKKALKELKRVSRRHCILSVPNEPLFSIMSLMAGHHISRFGKHPEHVNFWSKHEFVKFVSQEFQVKEIHSSIPWTIIVGEKNK